MNGRKAKQLRRDNPGLPHPPRLRGGVVGPNFEGSRASQGSRKRLKKALKKMSGSNA